MSNISDRYSFEVAEALEELIMQTHGLSIKPLVGLKIKQSLKDKYVIKFNIEFEATVVEKDLDED